MTQAVDAEPRGTLEIRDEGGRLTLVLAGHLDAEQAGPLWNRLVREVRRSDSGEVVAEAGGVTYCDGAGLALIVEARNCARGSGKTFELQNLPDRFRELLAPFHGKGETGPPPSTQRQMNALEEIGRVTVNILADFRVMLAFLGELCVKLPSALLRPHAIRWGETLAVFDRTGVNALTIVGMIGFLMGLIMGFQSAIPLREYGVDLFVVNLVALAMLRELGPIMTAIVLAGRSGSAFAAELGTMKVNEEIDALRTMALDPVRFLVLPRVLAGSLAMPVLTIYANVVGILGGLIVVVTIGHPWSAAFQQLVTAVDFDDILVGMIKSVVFGFIVAAVGCLRGLQTAGGAEGVGVSTTRSVVTSIFLIILVDAVFAAIFYSIGM